jgi:hypothetical protein
MKGRSEGAKMMDQRDSLEVFSKERAMRQLYRSRSNRA